jgi:spore coat protein A, manganese oxidase
MTRLNVYAGPAGFFIIRGGPEGDAPSSTPGPGCPPCSPVRPRENDKFPPNKTYYEIPIAIQDRSFNADGSLFYPDTREFFDGIVGPFIGPTARWSRPPAHLEPGVLRQHHDRERQHLAVPDRGAAALPVPVPQRLPVALPDPRLRQHPGVEVWQIGNEGGFLAAPVNLTAGHGQPTCCSARPSGPTSSSTSPTCRSAATCSATSGPTSRSAAGSPAWTSTRPTRPAPARSCSSGWSRCSTRWTTRRRHVPAAAGHRPAAAHTVTRPLALIEKMGMGYDANGEEIEGPVEALLGRAVTNPETGEPFTADLWMDAITENPNVGDTEIWEFYNFTGDAHPMHVHEVLFEVVERQPLDVEEEMAAGHGMLTMAGGLDFAGPPVPPEPWERGRKDTVIAYPGEVTRIKAQFKTPGQYVWHCHIVEHEDNEMMRPYRVGPEQPGQPMPMPMEHG